MFLEARPQNPNLVPESGLDQGEGPGPEVNDEGHGSGNTNISFGDSVETFLWIAVSICYPGHFFRLMYFLLFHNT